MRTQFTLTLSDSLKEELERYAQRMGVSQSAVVRLAIRDYIVTRRFRKLRNQFLQEAADQGIYSDKDVFERVS